MKKSKHKHKSVTGVVKRHPDGFGFLLPDDDSVADVYIPRKEMSGIMSNDRLSVRVYRESGGQRWRGELQEILSRSVKRVAGPYESLGNGKGCLRDHSFSWGCDLLVSNPENYTVREKDWISVEILTYPDSVEGFTGRLIAVLGDMADPLNDPIRILHTHQIPYGFSKRTTAEADRMPEQVSDADFRGRRDLRILNFVTIDGKTAKDFDDAIYVETQSSGFKLWVAIADVSHYVKANSAIDDDAYERGTSTYFPNFVAPMLPEKLSNELCSLKPKVPRLAFVAELTLDFSGEIRHSAFYEAVIESKARVTYGEAQEVIDGGGPDSLRAVAPMIRCAADLAKILMAKRFKEGSLELDIPETVIEVDDAGNPVDIMQSERLFSHRLIEELMLMANVSVARAFKSRGVPTLFRIHDQPNPEAMANLQAFLKILGSQRHLSGASLQKKITRALQDFAGHPQEHILNILTLRSMAQACYSTSEIGHFGLGFSDYSHFTSPIRRYPDLIVHRQLKALLKIPGYSIRSESELESAGVFLSACEQRSVKAERQIHSIKKARFMTRHLGEEFEGRITSVAKFGVFVLLRQFDVDGLVRLEDLPGDRYDFDEKNMRLVGRRSGRNMSIGDPMRVTVAAANVEDGRIDFVPAEGKKSADTPPPKGERFKKRHSFKDDSQRVRQSRFSQRRRKGKAR